MASTGYPRTARWTTRLGWSAGWSAGNRSNQGYAWV